MGQMTYAVMMGCVAPKLPRGTEWYCDGEELGVLESFRQGTGPTPALEAGGKIVGFFVAGGEKSGVPDLGDAVSMPLFEMDKRYFKTCVRARKAWARFVSHCGKHGVTLPYIAELYLVQTEVA